MRPQVPHPMRPQVLIGQDGINFLFIVRLRWMTRSTIPQYVVILTKVTMS